MNNKGNYMKIYKNDSTESCSLKGIDSVRQVDNCYKKQITSGDMPSSRETLSKLLDQISISKYWNSPLAGSGNKFKGTIGFQEQFNTNYNPAVNNGLVDDSDMIHIWFRQSTGKDENGNVSGTAKFHGTFLISNGISRKDVKDLRIILSNIEEKYNSFMASTSMNKEYKEFIAEVRNKINTADDKYRLKDKIAQLEKEKLEAEKAKLEAQKQEKPQDTKKEIIEKTKNELLQNLKNLIPHSEGIEKRALYKVSLDLMFNSMAEEFSKYLDKKNQELEEKKKMAQKQEKAEIQKQIDKNNEAKKEIFADLIKTRDSLMYTVDNRDKTPIYG